MKKLIIILAAAAMAGCGIYKPYTRPEEIKTDGLYGQGVETVDTMTLGNHFLAGDVHRSLPATAHSAGTGQQHRPPVGLLARKRGGSDAEVGTPGIPALVQLRSERRREQPDQPLERHVDLHRSRNGQLGGRYFRQISPTASAGRKLFSHKARSTNRLSARRSSPPSPISTTRC